MIAVTFGLLALATLCIPGRYGTRPTLRGLGVFLSLMGAIGLYDGGLLAIREYERTRDGRVVPALVAAKLSPMAETREETLRYHRARKYRLRWHQGLMPYDDLARFFLTGSNTVWIVEYQYRCEQPLGCKGRDFVSSELWHRLAPGQPIEIRLSQRASDTGRLEENPQERHALTVIGIALIMLITGLPIWAPIRLSRFRPRYLTAPAVVTAVEPVRYRDVTRWRITFAYFDPEGKAQDSADEVQTDQWKPGDACVAVFPPGQPDVAYFRPPNPA